MKRLLLILSAPLLSFSELRGDEPITWLVHYEAKSLPQEQGWKAVGELAAKAKLANGALHLVDDSAKADGAFRATWKPPPDTEIVVEATARVESVAARRGTGMWPAQQGVPVGLLVSDGVHQEGLLLRPEKIATYHDRVALFDAKTKFHTDLASIKRTGVLLVEGGFEVQR